MDNKIGQLVHLRSKGYDIEKRGTLGIHVYENICYFYNILEVLYAKIWEKKDTSPIVQVSDVAYGPLVNIKLLI